MLDSAKPGLLLGMAGEFLGVLEHGLPNRGNDLLPAFERHAVEFAVRNCRRGDSVIHCGKHAFAERLARST